MFELVSYSSMMSSSNSRKKLRGFLWVDFTGVFCTVSGGVIVGVIVMVVSNFKTQKKNETEIFRFWNKCVMCLLYKQGQKTGHVRRCVRVMCRNVVLRG